MRLGVCDIKNSRFALILAVLAIVVTVACGQSASSLSPTGPVSTVTFTLNRLVVGIPDNGKTETGTPVNGNVVPAGTMLRYNLFFTGPDGKITVTFVTKRGEVVVDTQPISGSSFSGGEVRAATLFTPKEAGNYTLIASITSATETVSATYEVR